MQGLTFQRLRAHFPHSETRANQHTALHAIANAAQSLILEAPTGEGKTEMAMAALIALSSQGIGPLFYVVPNKTLVDQVAERFRKTHRGTVLQMFGRADHECLYYEPRPDGTPITAQESPCYMLDCKHRVNMDTGMTVGDGAEPCPYFLAKFQALQQIQHGAIIITTMAFWLMNRIMVGSWRELEPKLTIIDEAHLLAGVARDLFASDLTDTHLRRCTGIVRTVDPELGNQLGQFTQSFMRIVASRSRSNMREPSLFKYNQIKKLIERLEEMDMAALDRAVAQALSQGELDAVRDRGLLKTFEALSKVIPRMLTSLRFSLPDEERGRGALNYVVAFHQKEDDPEAAPTGEGAGEGKGSERKARYRATTRPYFVQPMIRKACGTGSVIAMSATVGDPKVFGFETGFTDKHGYEMCAMPSSFNVRNMRLWMPKDAPDLSFDARRKRRDIVKDALNRVGDLCYQFSEAGHRSLVVVVSEEERQRFLRVAERYGFTNPVDIVSYGNGRTARAAAEAFRAGEGRVLVGTAAQYATGLDLPGGIAPIIFFLRPGYAPPNDPQSQFEAQRFSQGQRWALWNWRATIQALQVRGRNIRSSQDLGVCFFVSSQFRQFLYGSLPEWLKPAYQRDKKFNQAIEETLKLLQ